MKLPIIVLLVLAFSSCTKSIPKEYATAEVSSQSGTVTVKVKVDYAKPWKSFHVVRVFYTNTTSVEKNVIIEPDQKNGEISYSEVLQPSGAIVIFSGRYQ